MKALVLAAGKGTRIRALSHDRCKGMLTVLGKPLVEHSLDHAVGGGVDGIVVVINADAEAIRDRYGSSYRGIPMRYARQDDPRGLVEAIAIGAPLLGGDDFMLFLSDEILIGADHVGMVRRFHERRLSVVCGVMEGASPAMIRKNYDVIADPDRRIRHLVEKPTTPRGNLLGLGNCVFRHDVLGFLSKVPINPCRQQKDLIGLIQCAVDAGEPVEHYRLCEGYTNVNTPEDFESALCLLETTSHCRTT